MTPAERTATVGGTRHDVRRHSTRSSLVEAARLLITERGVAGLRVAEITNAADVGRGSFYNHFDSKEDLIEAVVGETLEALALTVSKDLPPEQDPAVRASFADRKFIRLGYEDPSFARLLTNLDRGDELFTSATLPYARAVLADGIDAGRLEIPDLEVAVVQLAGGALALIKGILEGRVPPDADMAHAELVLRMFGVAKDEAYEISHRPFP